MGTSPLAVYRSGGTSGRRDGHEGQQVIESCEVVGVGGEQRQVFGNGDGGDHQVGWR
jgi:hypothetical protein